MHRHFKVKVCCKAIGNHHDTLYIGPQNDNAIKKEKERITLRKI